MTTYNIHPLLVHFPIAFLFLYSMLAIIPFERWFPSIAWRHIRLVLLIAGVLGAMAASASGETAEHLMRADRQIVEAHSFFAGASTVLYGILLGSEVLTLGIPYLVPRFPGHFIVRFLSVCDRVLRNRMVVITLSILGLAAIVLTGLLGGVIVYGTTADPLAAPVLKLFGLQ